MNRNPYYPQLSGNALLRALKPLIEISLLGQNKVKVEGKFLRWYFHKMAESILYYCILHKDQVISVNDLSSVIFGTLSPNSRNYKKIVAEINYIIDFINVKDAKDGNQLMSFKKLDSGTYKFEVRNEIEIDVFTFSESYQNGLNKWKVRYFNESHVFFRQALNIYEGHLLPKFEQRLKKSDWITTHRNQFWRNAIRSFIYLVAYTKMNNDMETGIRYCYNFIKIYKDPLPYQEYIYATLATIYYWYGKDKDAKEAKNELEILLKSRNIQLYGLIETLSSIPGTNLPYHLLKNIGNTKLEVPKSLLVSNNEINSPVKNRISNLPPRHKYIWTTRKKLLDEFNAFLAMGERDFIISGTPGFGSSSFAIEAGYQAQTHFPLGTIWLNCKREIVSLEEIIKKISEMLEIQPEQLSSYSKSGNKLLIILDNLNTYFNFDVLRELRNIVPSISIIVVSSVQLEQEINMKSLFVGPLDISDSLQLLFSVCSDQNHVIHEVELEFVQKICLEADGYPLALIEAANNLKVMPATTVLLNFKKKLPILPEDSLNLLFSALSNSEVALLAYIAIFPSGANIEFLNRYALEINLPLTIKRLLKTNLISFNNFYYSVPKAIRQYIISIIPGELMIKTKNDAINYVAYLVQVYEQSPELLRKERENIEQLMTWLETENEHELFLKLVGSIGKILEKEQLFSRNINLLEKAVNIAKDTGNQFEQARFLNITGKVMAEIGAYETAILYGQEALKIQIALGNSIGVGSNLGLIAQILYRQGKFEMARDFCEQSLDIWKATQHLPGLIRSQRQLGKIFMRMGDHTKAENLLVDCLTMIKEKNPWNKEDIARVSAALGDLYFDMNNLPKAREYYFNILNLSLETGNKNKLADSYIRVTSLYRVDGRFEDAKKTCEKALEIFQEFGNKAAEAACYNSLGNIAYDQQYFNEAIEYYKKGIALKETVGDQFGVALAKLGLAKCMRKTGELKRAKLLALSSLQDFSETKSNLRIQDVHKLLNKIDTEENQFNRH